MPPEFVGWEQDGVRYAALVDGNKLIDLAVDRLGEPCLYQSLWRAKINRIVPHVGAFASYGMHTGLFRGFQHKSGDTVIAQVKSRRGEGKADILTDDISLGERYFIYLPRGDKIAVSKKIATKEATPVIEALQAAGIKGGILRSGALQVPIETVVAEALQLRETWLEVEQQPGPMLLEGPNAAQRLAHNYPQVTPFPHFPIRERDSHDLAPQIAVLLQLEIKLPKGGSVIIERTSALTAIDVNAGTRNPTEVDREALSVIAGQIRLRNLSGLIVIDFTAPKAKPDEVLAAVRRALADDPAGCRVVGITPSGLVELTRSARDLPLLEKLGAKRHSGAEG